MRYLQNRNNFITESRIIMLLESDLVLSDELKLILSNIDDKISKYILSIDKKDMDTRYNFIDITDNNNTISFTQDNRAQSILNSGDDEDLFKVMNSERYLTHSSVNDFIFRDLGYKKPTEEPYAPNSGTIGRILTEYGEKTTRNGNTYVVFQNEEGTKETVINKRTLRRYRDKNIKIWSTARNTIRVGRLVRYLLNLNGLKYTDSDIEKFVNKFKSNIDILNDAFAKFDIVSGIDIAHWYNCDNYHNEYGTLGESCMAKVDENFFDIYVENPDKISMLILYDDDGSINNGKYTSDKIKGRALIWQLDEGYTFLERIYTNDDSDLELFRNYALENNMYYKDRNVYTTDYKMIGKNDIKEGIWTVSLKYTYFDKYPYFDSLQWINTTEDQVSNSRDNWDSYDKIGSLTDTEGELE